MRTFRPSSWQAQARRLGDGLFGRIQNENDPLNGEKGLTHWFALGYDYGVGCRQRRKYVERRAAKRVGRKLRKIQKINEKIICGGY